MKEQNEHHSFTGMQRDIAISKNPSGFLYDARNIRITQREDDTLIAITNERGTESFGITISGDYLGHCLLNEWLVVFSTHFNETTQKWTDFIERINLKKIKSGEPNISILFQGNLNFSLEHPIEAIGSYENESVQKVYWTDGLNQPRIINITPERIGVPHAENSFYGPEDSTTFDFVREIDLNAEVSVRKVLGASGIFPGGVIQYAFTYYDKFGQESNVFYTTPLLYTSYNDRGVSPEDKADNAFEITVKNPDLRFDFVRIYSIMRTSENGTPICKSVQDLDIGILRTPGNTDTSLTFVDTNTTGEVIDPTELLYKGGEEITAQTIEQKDGTLFLGNINITRPNVRSVDFSGTDVVETAVQAAQAVEAVRIVQKVLEPSSPRRSRPIESSSHSADIIDDAVVVDIVGGGDMELIIDNKAVAVITNTDENTYVITSNDPDVDNSTTVVVDTDHYDVDDDISVVVSSDGNYDVDVIDDSVIVSRNDKDYDVVVGGYVISVAHDGDIPLIDGGYIIDVDNGNNTGSTGELIEDGQDIYYQNGGLTVRCAQRHLFFPDSEDTTYIYNNQLTGYSDTGLTKSSSCAGFKRGDYYRLGCQFQYKNGKWSEPVFIGDMQELDAPSFTVRSGNIPTHVTLPTFIGTLDASISETLYNMGYRKVRSVVVFPELYDRVTLCQGVANPTLFTTEHRDNNKDLYAQSSWFFRPYLSNNLSPYNSDKCTISPSYYEAQNHSKWLTTTHNQFTNSGSPLVPIYDPTNIRGVEIQGWFDDVDRFQIEDAFCTLHSPDIEFDEQLWLTDLTGVKKKCVGDVQFTKTLSNIDIQTESAPISSMGSGFVHKSFIQNYSYGIVSGLFWDDCVAEDLGADGTSIRAEDAQWSSCKWMVYSWNKTGSLNNDIDRPEGLGTRSAVLKKKVISNLRYAETVYNETGSLEDFSCYPQIFRDDQLSILKFNIGGTPRVYMGNIDTLLTPYYGEGMYFAFSTLQRNPRPINLKVKDVPTPFNSDYIWKITVKDFETSDGKNLANGGIYRYYNTNDNWAWGEAKNITKDIGNQYLGLLGNKDFVRMKYKSTPHLVGLFSPNTVNSTQSTSVLRIYEVIKPGDNSKQDEPLYRQTMFGGVSKDAFQANTWLPCGEPVTLSYDGQTDVEFNFWYGDTYYQRWDCLKTYPFTREDINQIVEIGSFMLETHVNIDGRYDRNRGQLDNTNMSPINFNLMNPVYSQLNNFYSYKILDSKFYLNNSFPNQVTWTKEKQAGADIDLWTNITLASTYDMDGSKGEVISLNTWKDSIFCFQNKGISNILFNSRVQIPTSDGVPIEISNSYKVDGYRYITDGTGCVNKWSIRETPAGIYFIDSVTNDLYHVGEGLTDVSLTHNMQTWFKDNTIDRTLYDDVHHDIYLVNDTEALCYSEILGQFTSFMDYGGISLIESYDKDVFTLHDVELYRMFTGEYNLFFDYPGSSVTPKPWYITFISNGLDNKDMDFDKIFTNIDYRMDMFDSTGAYLPEESFDTIRVFNEYQDTGDVTLKHPVVIGEPISYNLDEMNLEKKYRIWRIQIPRDSTNILDRIRNPWCKITLSRNAQDNNKAVLQDLNVQYFV